MDAYGPKAWKPAPTPRASERPRRILTRASLQQVREVRSSALKHLARSPQATDSAEACAPVRAIALSAPANVALGHDWDHANASYWFWATDAREDAFVYNEDVLLVAGTAGAAEFEVSRSFSASSVGERIFKVLIDHNTQLAGYWHGISSGLSAVCIELRQLAGSRVTEPLLCMQAGASIPRLPPNELSEL